MKLGPLGTDCEQAGRASNVIAAIVSFFIPGLRRDCRRSNGDLREDGTIQLHRLRLDRAARIFREQNAVSASARDRLEHRGDTRRLSDISRGFAEANGRLDGPPNPSDS